MSLIGLDKLNRRLDAIADNRETLRRAQIASVAEAKRLTVPIRKTGFLGRNITPGALSDTSALVVSRAPYSRYVEEGTGLYGPKRKKIVPKRAKVLAWRTGAVRLTGRSRTSGGRELAGWAFARSVRGRAKTPFLRPGVQKAIKGTKLKADIIDRWNRAA